MEEKKQGGTSEPKERKLSGKEWAEKLKNTPIDQWLATESEDGFLIMKGPLGTEPWRKQKEQDEPKQN